MVEEEAVKETKEAQPPPKSKLKLIVLASTVLLLGVGGFLAGNGMPEEKWPVERLKNRKK